MTDDADDWGVLVPVAVLEGETVPESVIELLSSLPVTLLGYHVLPEQTPPGQARLQFEDRAQDKLAELADAFRNAGAATDTRLVFTNDAEQTFDRVADETGCGAILHPNPTGPVERLLVPLHGEANAERIGQFLIALIRNRPIEVTLYTVVETDEDTSAETLLETVAEQLRTAGVPTSRISRETVVSDAPIREIADASVEYDAVVMGEPEPSLSGLLFGDAGERVAERSLGPVVVVRRGPE